MSPRLLTGFGMLVFFTNVSLAEFQVRYLVLFPLFSVIDSFERFWMENLHKNIQLMLDLLKAPILVLLYINDLPEDVACDISIYADDITLYSKCDQASDLWQQLELDSKLESDLEDTVDWDKKWLLISMLGKLDSFCLTGLITMVLLL